MPKALGKRHVEGIGEGSLTGTLARLLQLTGDAVVAFDGAGRVLLANEEAATLFWCPEGGLVGADVRELFHRDADEPLGAFAPGDLPVPTDGSAAMVLCRTAAGHLSAVRVRCDAVHAPGETYLLVARLAGDVESADHESERTIAELRRANRRLSGALNIVLDTLDYEDVGTLFGRTLEEICETMEADGVMAYIADSGGFHLRGATEGVDTARAPRFMEYGRGLETLAARSGRSQRIRVLAPSGEALRQGRLTMREVVNEETHEVLKIASRRLPPFTSFIVVPVWFDGHAIGIIEVGWERLHPLREDDAKLLDAVAHYLSVQLVGALSAMRAQRAESFETLGCDLREELMTISDPDKADSHVHDVLADAAEALDAALVPLAVNAHQSTVVADLPLMGSRALPVGEELSGLLGREKGVSVIDVAPDSELAQTLRELGEPCVGALMDMGEIGAARQAALVLRPDGEEPLDEVEHAFLLRLAQDVHDIFLGEAERRQDKRISQALQRGMRNELQHVDGLTAQGLYSSATAAAFVGGDFYDLISLPGRRACVIMGDVSGKGVEAASVSAAVKTALGAYAWEGLAPARMVRSLNDFLLGFSRLETFATLFVGIIDLAAATITYCSAGHPPALLVRRGAQEISMLDVQSGVVGAFPDITYRDGVISVGTGDVLMLYTDGTTEARDPSGAFFGEQGLRDMLMRESAPDKPFEGFLDRLLATLDDFTGQRLDDDVAMVAVRFDELGEKGATAPTATPSAGVSGQFADA